jgi:energy-converting hydrogenase Eha subunit C
MQFHWIGPLVGVGVSLVCSGLGVLVSSTLGGDVAASATLVHAAAAVVLLVTILSRMESRES